MSGEGPSTLLHRWAGGQPLLGVPAPIARPRGVIQRSPPCTGLCLAIRVDSEVAADGPGWCGRWNLRRPTQSVLDPVLPAGVGRRKWGNVCGEWTHASRLA